MLDAIAARAPAARDAESDVVVGQPVFRRALGRLSRDWVGLA